MAPARGQHWGSLGPVPLVLVASLVLFWTSAAAARLTCRAEVDRQSAAPGQNVVLTLHAAGPGSQAPRHDPPVIAGTEVVPGGTSQSYSMDGSGTSISVTAVYYLRSTSGADVTIPPIAFQAGQWRCATEPITVRIDTAAAPAPGPAEPSRPPEAGRQTVPQSGHQAGRPGDQVFITLEADRDEVWLGEQIVLVFRYHRLRNTWGQPSYTAPRTEGFWRVDLPPERTFSRVVEGRIYEITEIRYALFPTRAGQLLIEPARLTLPGDPFGRIFGRTGGQRQLATDSLLIRVRNWPEPAPPGFSGIAAGQLDFSAGLGRQEVPRGEPVTLSLRVSADAFLRSYGGLAVPEQPGMRLFDSTEDVQEDLSGPRYMSVFVQEKALVPLQEGELPIPALELVYFDTVEGRYRIARAEAPLLKVAPSDLPASGDDPSGFRRAEIARIGHDLAFIHPAAGPLRSQAPPPVLRSRWWLGLLAPWVLLCGYRWRLRRRAMSQRDPAGRRRRQAWQRARPDLRRLGRRPGEAAELARAILGYAADHMDRSAAGLTVDEVRSWCEACGQAQAGRRLADILASCDQARFGGRGTVDVAAMAREVLGLLASVERSLQQGTRARRARKLRLPRVFVILPCCLVVASSLDASAAGRGPDPVRLLAEGNHAYTAGDLDAALRLYQEALDRGVDDAVLHYNIGNTLARRGELGRAVASYLRAKRLAPRDRDVRANLAWVRANTRDLELAGQGLPPVIAQLDAAVHLLALDEWAVLLVVLSWLTALFVAWTWRRGRLSSALRRWRFLLVGSLLVAAVAVATLWYAERGRDMAVVVRPEVAVRSGPADSFPVVFRIHDGLTLEIRGEREGWARIGLGGDWVGWVAADDLERVVQR